MIKTHAEIKLLLQLLDESFEKKAWHGPNLRGSIRGIDHKQAGWRPCPNRHNIWEIVVHCTYWKYVVRRRILGDKKGSFALKGSNWFERPDERSERAWKSDVELLSHYHNRLRETIAELNARDLSVIPRGSKVSNAAILTGIASHDVYHAGQIQLLRRLMK